MGEGVSVLLPNLPILRYALSGGRYPFSSRLVRFSAVSPNIHYGFSFVGSASGDKQCPSVISYSAEVHCPGSLPSSDSFNHLCVTFVFSLTQMFGFLYR